MSWSAMVPALVVPFLCALVYFVWIPQGNGGRGAYAFTKVWVLIYPLFFFGWIGLGGLVRREDREANWPSWKVVIWSGLASGAAIALIGWLMVLTPIGDIVREHSHKVVAKAEGLGFRERHRFLLVATFITVFHSAMEEYYWRWFVYGHLRQMVGHWPGHIIAAVAFTGHHVVLTLQFFPVPLALFLSVLVVLGGMIWTLMYEWHGSVWGCWLSHLVVDGFLMVVGYRLLMDA
jgi:membrane protease YdiL (CAAX protease family)